MCEYANLAPYWHRFKVTDYGPTNETLRDYLRERFPSLSAHAPDPDPAHQRSDATLIEQRADSIFGAHQEDKPPEQR